MSDTQKILIIVGPNGAGKTTFARECRPLANPPHLDDNSGDLPFQIDERDNS